MINNLISVIVPVYKVEEELLRFSIESILEQSYKNLEILLIDDGSPDHCGQICDEYARSDTRVRCIHTENQGVSSARNTGLEECNGEYVVFVDSDDYISKDMIQNLYDALQRNGAECAMCGCKKVFSVGVSLEAENTYECKCVTTQELMDDLFYMRHPYDGFEMTAVWGKLYKKQLVQNILFRPSMKIGEDFVFNLHVFQKVSTMVYIQTNEYGYYIRQNSAMRSGFDMSKMDVLQELEKLVIDYKDSNCEAGVISRVVNIAIVLLLMIPIDVEYTVCRRQIQEFIKQYRWRVLINRKSRKKVKFALLSTYLGFNTMQKIFEKIS